jgi:ribosomal protein S18 acetylase RimI-like enzyme
MKECNIEETKDANRVAILNEPVQRLHFERYPEYFKEYSYESTLEYFTEQLKKENWYCYIIKVGNDDIGYVLFFERDYKENPFRKTYKGIQIDQICINEEYRHKGYANKLMERVIEYCRKIKATQIELTYWEKNIEAKEFYDKFEFKRKINFVVLEIK